LILKAQAPEELIVEAQAMKSPTAEKVRNLQNSRIARSRNMGNHGMFVGIALEYSDAVSADGSPRLKPRIRELLVCVHLVTSSYVGRDKFRQR
jgi:hypothetical protein